MPIQFYFLKRNNHGDEASYFPRFIYITIFLLYSSFNVKFPACDWLWSKLLNRHFSRYYVNRTISFRGLIKSYPCTNHYVEKQKQRQKIGKTAHENVLSYYFAANLWENITWSENRMKWFAHQRWAKVFKIPTDIIPWAYALLVLLALSSFLYEQL